MKRKTQWSGLARRELPEDKGEVQLLWRNGVLGNKVQMKWHHHLSDCSLLSRSCPHILVYGKLHTGLWKEEQVMMHMPVIFLTGISSNAKTRPPMKAMPT